MFMLWSLLRAVINDNYPIRNCAPLARLPASFVTNSRLRTDIMSFASSQNWSTHYLITALRMSMGKEILIVAEQFAVESKN